eukprot:CAMPEP_0115836260 /NCGR_PEP_ID=MMETSP0287-20121206/4617_1 /TAXON_ID=412157 /ORGANISM="Chrysochromulina rotalis, Strain UIO044" /LENGTH=136 /DNA_ID=CAMNT_0003289741 /DNA_START=182 /DNA_END=592 /DNA_ORIENTATION=-
MWEMAIPVSDHPSSLCSFEASHLPGRGVLRVDARGLRRGLHGLLRAGVVVEGEALVERLERSRACGAGQQLLLAELVAVERLAGTREELTERPRARLLLLRHRHSGGAAGANARDRGVERRGGGKETGEEGDRLHD